MCVLRGAVAFGRPVAAAAAAAMAWLRDEVSMMTAVNSDKGQLSLLYGAQRLSCLLT